MKINPFEMAKDDVVRITGDELVRLYELGVFNGSLDLDFKPVDVVADFDVVKRKRRLNTRVWADLFKVEDFCPNCGCELAIYWKFCPICGAALEGFEEVRIDERNGVGQAQDEHIREQKD